jgi:hypothetical protein
MASPFQQQVRQRKFIYIALILALFTGSWAWRATVVRAQADALAIREVDRGDVELTGAVVRLGLTGSRGLAICLLWNSAIDKQKKNQWNELEVLVRSVTKLQPHFITPWLFQSWNLSYNVSVECDRIRDKYFYISRGVDLLAEGERQNRNHPDLRWNVGFYMQHKICVSDETNYHRSLFQLSMIPTNERDPARFWKRTESETVFNWVEFHNFVEQHPQLVRRLHEGMHQENLREKKRLFICNTPEDVVQFLEDNFNVPSLYRFTPPPGNQPGSVRNWEASKKDEFLPPLERFPPLPPPVPERFEGMAPPHPRVFDSEALTFDLPLSDDVDAHAAAHAWYCYSMEPLPPPGPLPGSSEPITDRTRQRLNRYMTTLIFRDYPAQAKRFMAERLQQEGWFDEEPWDISVWFDRAGELAGKEVKVGGGRKWSEDAWRRAALDWKKHGEENHLIFPSPSAEANKRKLAEDFAKHRGLGPYAPIPKLRADELSPEEKEEYEAAKWMHEYNAYRQVSNFAHQLVRCTVEATAEAVACRKLFYKAEKQNLEFNLARALDEYRTPVELPAWSGRKLSPLDAWRELVLLKNKDYRRDSFLQENTAEIQVHYLLLLNRLDGKKLKEEIGRAATLLPLVPKFTHDTFRAPIFDGPFDVADSEGVPLIDDRHIDMVLTRMRLPEQTRRRFTEAPKAPPKGPYKVEPPRAVGGS